MNENVDRHVINPGIGINKTLEAVYIQFEVMDATSQTGTGKTHPVLMPTPDTMILLRQLERMQQAFSLPIPTDPLPQMVEISDKRKN